MSKTTALTFTAAVVLFAACLTISHYGNRIDENRMYTSDGQYLIFDADIVPDTWEQVTGLTGLLAFAVAFAGALLWHGELYPQARRASVLGLEERTGRRIIRAAIPRKIPAAAKIHVDENGARSYEEESLTPLERVIRGY